MSHYFYQYILKIKKCFNVRENMDCLNCRPSIPILLKNFIDCNSKTLFTLGYYKVVCYFTNWAWYRRGLGKYVPEDIDENLCTHIVYGFAVLDYENLIVKAHDSWADFDNSKLLNFLGITHIKFKVD